MESHSIEKNDFQSMNFGLRSPSLPLFSPATTLVSYTLPMSSMLHPDMEHSGLSLSARPSNAPGNGVRRREVGRFDVARDFHLLPRSIDQRYTD
jgi:hypothetical protein